MLRKVFILPIDGLESAQAVIEKINSTLQEPSDMVDYVSHIKLNDALHLEGKERILSFIIGNFYGINIFFDLKLPDTNGTDKNILKRYSKFMRPGDIVTVTSTCSLRAFKDIRSTLPSGVKIAIPSVLSDTPNSECQYRRGSSPGVAILNDALNLLSLSPEAQPFDAVVCAPAEVVFLKRNLPSNIQLIVPGVRDLWMEVGQQSADRISGIKEILDDGVDFGVLGAQLFEGNPKNGIDAIESRRRSIDRALESKTMNIIPDDPLRTLINLRGYYKSPETREGKFVGPLVAYAGTYDSPTGRKNYVGDTYFNLSVIESHPLVLNYYAQLMANKILEFKAEGIPVDCLVGVPTGGVKIAQEVARILNLPGICLEKEVLAVKTATEKEKFDLVFRRNAGVIKFQDNVIIFEDLCNNFSTTSKAVTAVEEAGGSVIAISCIINRSMDYIEDWDGFPIIAGISLPSPQFEQEDQMVADLIAQGLLSADPKKDWAKLKQAMEQ